MRRFPETSAQPAGYRIPLPKGSYEIIFHFAEVYGKKIGRRFDIRLEGKEARSGVEFSEKDYSVARQLPLRAEVSDGLLDIEFVPQVSEPLLSALEIRP